MNDCIFCKIVRGDIPSFKVYETDDTLAFLDIHPVTKGHTLIIPKNHSHTLMDISPSDWAHVSETVRVVAIALEQSLNADGINLRMNNREHAGQDVFHPHVHLIPRFKGDGLKQWPQGSYIDGEAEAITDKIRSTLNRQG